MVTDVRKVLDAVAKRAGWTQGEITTKMFRHTYISARIQTTHSGAPVAAFTVAREVGHSSTAMIERCMGISGRCSIGRRSWSTASVSTSRRSETESCGTLCGTLWTE